MLGSDLTLFFQKTRDRLPGSRPRTGCTHLVLHSAVVLEAAQIEQESVIDRGRIATRPSYSVACQGGGSNARNDRSFAAGSLSGARGDDADGRPDGGRSSSGVTTTAAALSAARAPSHGARPA